MSKKDYEQVAAVIAEEVVEAMQEEFDPKRVYISAKIARGLAGIFREDPKFDAREFFAACALDENGDPGTVDE